MIVSPTFAGPLEFVEDDVLVLLEFPELPELLELPGVVVPPLLAATAMALTTQQAITKPVMMPGIVRKKLFFFGCGICGGYPIGCCGYCCITTVILLTTSASPDTCAAKTVRQRPDTACHTRMRWKSGKAWRKSYESSPSACARLRSIPPRLALYAIVVPAAASHTSRPGWRRGATAALPPPPLRNRRPPCGCRPRTPARRRASRICPSLGRGQRPAHPPVSSRAQWG